MRHHNTASVGLSIPVPVATHLAYYAGDVAMLSKFAARNSIELPATNPLVEAFVRAVACGDPRTHFYLRCRTHMRYLREEAAHEPNFRRHVFVTSRQRPVVIVLSDASRMWLVSKADPMENERQGYAQYAVPGCSIAEFIPCADLAWRALPTVQEKWSRITDVIPASQLDECMAAFVYNSATPTDNAGVMLLPAYCLAGPRPSHAIDAAAMPQPISVIFPSAYGKPQAAKPVGQQKPKPKSGGKRGSRRRPGAGTQR